MRWQKRISLLTIMFLGSCGALTTPYPVVTSISTPSPNVISSPTFTPEPIYTSTPDPKEALSHYGLIAFTSEKDGNEDIFTMHADGSNQTNITNNPARDIDPAWSPDGKKIAFISTRTGKPHVFTMNPDGSDVTQLADGIGSGFFFEWSPDGKKIAYVTYSDDPNIYTAELIVIDADGKNKTILANNLFSEYEVLGWSPDSKNLVYTIPDGYDGAGLYIVKADGTRLYKWPELSFINRIHWLDNENFVAYGLKENAQSMLTQSMLRLSIDGSRTELYIPDMIIATLFDKSYIAENYDGLSSFTFEGTLISSFPFYKKCEDSVWDAYFSISPDKKLSFVTAFCSNKSSFFIVNDSGTFIQQVGELQYSSVETTDAGWSPDSKYVARVISYVTPDYRTEEDIYLFDIQKMLKDPSLQPIRLTTDGATKNFHVFWQPIP